MTNTEKKFAENQLALAKSESINMFKYLNKMDSREEQFMQIFNAIKHRFEDKTLAAMFAATLILLYKERESISLTT